jgi:hypothetical protein
MTGGQDDAAEHISSSARPEPGIKYGVPFGQYRDWPAINNSTLKHCNHSPAHMREVMTGGQKESTPAMRMGTLVHAGKFEPLLIPAAYVVLPDYHLDADNVTAKGLKPSNPRNTSYYREKVAQFEATNSGKEVISGQQYADLLGVVSALEAHEGAATAFGAGGVAEVSFVWTDPDTGILCKGRADWWDAARGIVSDLKKADSGKPFKYVGRNMFYHQAAAFYIDGLRTLGHDVKEFWLVAVESKAPYAVQAAPIDEESLNAGRARYKRALEAVRHGRTTGEWAGPDSPDRWHFEEHKEEPVDLVLPGGEVLTI